MRLSYLYNGHSYTGNIASLYWNAPMVPCFARSSTTWIQSKSNVGILDGNGQQNKILLMGLESLYDSDPSVCYDIHSHYKMLTYLRRLEWQFTLSYWTPDYPVADVLVPNRSKVISHYHIDSKLTIGRHSGLRIILGTTCVTGIKQIIFERDDEVWKPLVSCWANNKDNTKALHYSPFVRVTGGISHLWLESTCHDIVFTDAELQQRHNEHLNSPTTRLFAQFFV